MAHPQPLADGEVLESDLEAELDEAAEALAAVEVHTRALEGTRDDDGNGGAAKPAAGAPPRAIYRRVERRIELEKRVEETQAKLARARRTNAAVIEKASARTRTRLAVVVSLVGLVLFAAYATGHIALLAFLLLLVAFGVVYFITRRRARRRRRSAGLP